ncbi:hypothetical protein [Pendulispora albinea]|uniref:Uncharacterized protein n=1 Tax=Pendulispora albinea TaxID=2741071 RepID=A0ABZ2M858_9BACT
MKSNDAEEPHGDPPGKEPTTNGDNDSVGEVVERVADAPEVTKVTTFGLRSGDFPAYVSHLLGGKWDHLFQNITIRNPNKSKQTVVLSGALAGYTKTPATGTVKLDPGQEVSGWFDAALDFEALDKITSPVTASIELKLTTQEGKVLFASTKPTRVLPKNTVIWKDFFRASHPTSLGLGFLEMKIAALSLTTPHDGWGEIDKLLHEAATYSTYKSISGYAAYHKADSTLDQDQAGFADQVGSIWSALKARGFNYTNVPQNFFAASQNVRYPAESLRVTTGNCIDGTLVLASVLEAIGMEPFINYVPGHAFVGAHLAPKGSPNYGYYAIIETTMLGTSSFADATMTGLREYNQNKNAGTLVTFEVSEGRAEGYLPSPFPLR